MAHARWFRDENTLHLPGGSRWPREPLSHDWKLLRAFEHLQLLDYEIDRWVNSDGVQLIDEFDPERSEHRQRVFIRHEPPPHLGVILGDCLQNLRNLLDNLVYALAESQNNGPLPEDRAKVVAFPVFGAQPTERLLYSAEYLRKSCSNGIHFKSPLDILRHLDQQAGLRPMAGDALKTARQLVREQRSSIPPSPEGLAAHFNFVLDTVDHELTTRIERGLGLGDPLGAPNLGNPTRYLNAAQVDEFGGMYHPDPAYDSWRQLRTLVLARRRPSAQKHAAIEAWLAMGARRGPTLVC